MFLEQPDPLEVAAQRAEERALLEEQEDSEIRALLPDGTEPRSDPPAAVPESKV